MGITGKQRGQVILSGLGVWKDQPFNAADFSCTQSMTVTVTPPVLQNRWMRIGNTVFWTFLAVVEIGGTPSWNVYVKAPTPVKGYHNGFGRVLAGAPAQLPILSMVGSPAGQRGQMAVGWPGNALWILNASTQIYFSVFYEVGE